MHDLEAIKADCDMIVANRWSDELADMADKVYTRDLFKRDLPRSLFLCVFPIGLFCLIPFIAVRALI